MSVFWSLVGFCVLLATFLAWREQYQKARARQTERETAVHECFNRAAELLKNGTHPGLDFCSFFKAEPYKLESNDEVKQVCDLLTEIGFQHPFRRIETHVLQNEWLDFMRWGKNHPELNFKDGAGYLRGAVKWNHTVKKRTDAPLGLEPSLLAEMLDH